ncbi:MAG TPA: ATP-binding protein [Acholeplasmataceae bacterium]|nr:ATP-binding protein [Acholeplasmataceae bacterium]
MNNTIIDKIKTNLSILGMKHTFENIDGYLDVAIKNKTPLIDFLDLLLDMESKGKINRSVENQIRMAGFPGRKTFELYDFSFQPQIDLEVMNDLRTLRFITNAENIVFLGTPGVGKTHLAIALGILAIEHKYSTYFVNCHNLIQNLLKASHENRLEERLKQYSKYKVLIIDEIGYLPTNIEGANLFFQLIARRYEKHSTILTTNKNFGEWGDIFQDLTISAAILDRVLHHSTVIKIVGESYRLKERKEFMSSKNNR